MDTVKSLRPVPIIPKSKYTTRLANKYIVKTLKEIYDLSKDKTNFKEIGSAFMGLYMIHHRNNIPAIKNLTFEIGRKSGVRWINTIGKDPEKKIKSLNGKVLFHWIITFLYLNYFNKEHHSDYLENLHKLLQNEVLNEGSVKKLKKFMFPNDPSKYHGFKKKYIKQFQNLWSFIHAYIIMASHLKSSIGKGIVINVLKNYIKNYRPHLEEFIALKNREKLLNNKLFKRFHHDAVYWITHIIFTLVNFTGNIIKNADKYFLKEIKFLENSIPIVIEMKDNDMLGEMIDVLTILNRRDTPQMNDAINTLLKIVSEKKDIRSKSDKKKINYWYHTPEVTMVAFCLDRKEDDVVYPDLLKLFE